MTRSVGPAPILSPAEWFYVFALVRQICAENELSLGVPVGRLSMHGQGTDRCMYLAMGKVQKKSQEDIAHEGIEPTPNGPQTTYIGVFARIPEDERIDPTSLPQPQLIVKQRG